MGYKLLGWVVWNVARWYLRGARWYVGRRYGAAPRNVAIGVLVAGGIGAALVAQRRRGA